MGAADLAAPHVSYVLREQSPNKTQGASPPECYSPGQHLVGRSRWVCPLCAAVEVSGPSRVSPRVLCDDALVVRELAGHEGSDRLHVLSEPRGFPERGAHESEGCTQLLA